METSKPSSSNSVSSMDMDASVLEDPQAPSKNARRLNMLVDVAAVTSGVATSIRLQRKALDNVYQTRLLDRVNVLGNGSTYGHTGCVNALSWASNGELLITGSDDRTVRLWRMDSSDGLTEYPFKCDTVINTRHMGNIFNAQMLPNSSRIATVAGDGKVMVYDVGKAMTTSISGSETQFPSSETRVRLFNCHGGRTKRVVTEASSDSFLTVAEDGTVRQHDLRKKHKCSEGGCPQPLCKLPHDLSTIALSPLAPSQFVVAGDSSYGYLFDRRQTGRIVQEEWGVPVDESNYTTCVRRFGRRNQRPTRAFDNEHITGARMAKSNSHEVLLSYSADAVYLFSTRDDPVEPTTKESGVLPSNRRSSTRSSRRSSVSTRHSPIPGLSIPQPTRGREHDSDDMPELASASESSDEEEDDDSESEDDETSGESRVSAAKFKQPVVMPRARYAGACNVQTVKDVNFIGPDDQYIASGSDDGNFFLWQKSTQKVVGIYEGDESIVNVIEEHPHLPLLAVSGIDNTVKLFAPTNGRSEFSKLSQKEDIIETNERQSGSGGARIRFSSLLMQYHLAMRALGRTGEDGEEETELNCPHQ